MSSVESSKTRDKDVEFTEEGKVRYYIETLSQTQGDSQ